MTKKTHRFSRPMKAIRALSIFVTLWLSCAGPLGAVDGNWIRGTGLELMSDNSFRQWVETIETTTNDFGPPVITEPRDGVVIPADSAAPQIRWQSDASTWVVRITSDNHQTINAICSLPFWEPEADLWYELISRNVGMSIRIEVLPVGGPFGRSLGIGPEISVHIDPDPLDAAIGYLQLPLPFRKAQQHPEAALWRKGTVSSPGEPEIILSNLPICANCHTYSADGTTLAYDMDIDGDKGSYVRLAAAEKVNITRAEHGSWNHLKVETPAPFSFGLFASLSSTGRYLLGTVGETSLFVMIDHKDFSQLFYPVTGQIAVFDHDRNSLALVPGTHDPGYVHTGPRLSPDDRTLVFSRAPVNEHYVDAVLNGHVRGESSQQRIEELNRRYPVQFDLYAIPFPADENTQPEPLAGASANGMSNFFPRFSPDGRWIVFTRSPTGLVGQPGSELWVIPATGGDARKLTANTPLMNSWHGFSPDGRWLVFSAKGSETETQTFLSRFYEDGTTAPALRLHRFSQPGFANVTPEFLPGNAARISSIQFTIEQNKQGAFENNVR